MRADNFLFFGLCTKHRLIFTHRHRFASSAQRFDKDRLRLFIKASLPARGVTITGEDRRFACTFAAPTAATSVSAAGPRAGSTRGRVLFYFFQSLCSTQPFQRRCSKFQASTTSVRCHTESFSNSFVTSSLPARTS